MVRLLSLSYEYQLKSSGVFQIVREMSGNFIVCGEWSHYYVFVCIAPGKAVPEMTYTVSGGTLNPTHSRSRWF